MSRRITMRAYKSIARKTHQAYAALKAASDTAEYGDAEQIFPVLSRMQAAVDALRVQACGACRDSGYYETPDDPYTGYRCQHPDVPFVNVRTGEEYSA